MTATEYNAYVYGEAASLYHIKSGKVYDQRDKIVKNKIVKINGNRYYANKNGVVVKSKIFKYSNGKYYYAQTKGNFATSKMFIYKGKRYYALSDGSLASGRMIDYKGNRYYASKNRNIVTKKLFTYKNKMFYAQNKGALAKGKMVTYNGKKYYAGSRYELVKNKKVLIKGDYYYFGTDGVLVTNKTIVLDGVKYKTDSNGKLTKVKTTSTTTQSTTQEKTTEEKKPSKTGCNHKWVVDEKAHYEWNSRYNEKGVALSHNICPHCGLDIDDYAVQLNKEGKITGTYWGDAIWYHATVEKKCDYSSGNPHTIYFYCGRDKNGNLIEHPHKGEGVGMDTYIPASYKCSECGAKVYMNIYNTALYTNLYNLQKDGKNIDISKLTWVYKDINVQGNKSIKINIDGKNINAKNYYGSDL